MCLEMVLIQLQKKIDKIEDEDINYRENKKWIKYRSQQNAIYEKIKKDNEMEM